MGVGLSRRYSSLFVGMLVVNRVTNRKHNNEDVQRKHAKKRTLARVRR